MGTGSTSVRHGPLSLAKLLPGQRLAVRDRWTRAELETHQRTQLETLRRFAVERSPFYGEFHSEQTRAPLAALPILTKKALMGPLA